jgi:hypothetical protein
MAATVPLKVVKNGFQKEKFTINSTTGELRYKDKQTQVGDHKVNNIDTDIAGLSLPKVQVLSLLTLGRLLLIV